MDDRSYQHLYPLKESNYEIIDGEPDIIEWKVYNEADAFIGTVKDLLFDNQSNAVRYLVIDLSGNGMPLDQKRVMIPIGIAHLHTKQDQVVLPNLHFDQLAALPNYEEGAIGPETETAIRRVIGSPAALRIEETIIEFDQQQFYNHQHFNRDYFYRRNPGEKPSS
jgi:hypothetical protein